MQYQYRQAIVSSNTIQDADEAADKLFHSAFGASVKAAYTADTFTAKAAADFDLEKAFGLDKKYEFKMDAALNVAVSPITADVYFALADKLLSAKVATDLTSFDVPVALTVTGADLINKQDLRLGAKFTVDKLAITAKGGYVISGDDANTVKAGASVEYKTDTLTAKAGADWSTKIGTEKSMVLSATASVESTALVPGATLSLAYGKDSADNTINFLAGQAKAQNFGAVTAKCKIAF